MRTSIRAYPFAKVIQNLDLNQCLVVEALLVANDFNGHRLPSAVVSTVQDLTERTLSKRVNHFVTVCEMVMRHDEVVAALIVISVIVRRIFGCCRFFLALRADAVYRWVVQNFLPFII